MSRQNVVSRLSMLVLCGVAVVASACAPTASECRTDGDCSDRERCVSAGGVLVQGGRCVPLDIDGVDNDTDGSPDADAGDVDGRSDIDDDCSPEDDSCENNECQPANENMQRCSRKGVCGGSDVPCAVGPDERCEDYYGPDYESNETSFDGKDNDCDGKTVEVFREVAMYDENLVCGLTIDDAIYCWGDHASEITESFPIDDESYVGLAVGSKYVCGRVESGEVTCRGTTSSGNEILTSLDQRFGEISGTRSTVCGIGVGGDVLCWSTSIRQSGPPDVGFTSLSISGDVRCGLYGQGGEVTCWPANNVEGSTSRLVGDEPARSGYELLDVAEGGFTCAGDSGAHVDCWGDVETRNPPGSPDDSVELGDLAAGIFQGKFGACYAESESGRRACWGFLKDVEHLLPEGPISQMDFGKGQAGCAVRRDNTLACWPRAPEP